MRRSIAVTLAGILAGATLLACGSSSSSAAGPPVPATGYFIVISNLSFIPLNLHVPAGQVVTVINRDGMEHSVTSEATPGAYTHGSVGGVSFDTGPFTGVRTFAIQGTAASGTVIPFYCTVHAGTMNTPNGSITIDPSALPTTAPGGAGGGGGGGGGY